MHFVHTYQKSGPFWFPVSTESVTEVRIFGSTSLTINYFDYTPNSLQTPETASAAAARRHYPMRKIGILHPSARRRTPRVNQCLILAAGNGRRLISASGGSPKPLVQLHGKSLLEHVILGAREAGIDRFVIVVGYGADAMRRWFADRPLGGVSVDMWWTTLNTIRTMVFRS